MTARLLIVLALFVASFGAHAFGPVGHQVVAEIAARHLDPKARAEVSRLLGDRPSHAMREVASWPDSLKEWPGYGPSMPLHYINFPRNSCDYQPQRDCRDGRCAVGALDHFIDVLRHSHDERARADALKWVIHLVADIHQPLHAGYADDRGGNQLQLQFAGRGSNLHKIWDSGLIGERKLRPVPYAEYLLSRRWPRIDASWMPGAAARWIEESCRLIESERIYPGDRGISRDYVRRELPVVERRMTEAGLRLAALLNAIF